METHDKNKEVYLKDEIAESENRVNQNNNDIRGKNHDQTMSQDEMGPKMDNLMNHQENEHKNQDEFQHSLQIQQENAGKNWSGQFSEKDGQWIEENVTNRGDSDQYFYVPKNKNIREID